MLVATVAAGTLLEAAAGAQGVVVQVHDECRPPWPPGACVKEGRVPFDDFIFTLMHHQVQPDWFFSPSHFGMQAGLHLTFQNTGG